MPSGSGARETMIPLMRAPPAALATALALLGALLAPPPAAAQDSADRVRAEAVVEGSPAAAGGTAVLSVTLTMDPTWKIYGPGDLYPDQVTSFEVTAGAGGLALGPFLPTTEPKAVKYDWEDGPRMEFDGSVVYRASVAIPAGTPPGERRLEGVAVVNACDPSVCLEPGRVPFAATLTVVPAGSAAAVPPPPPPAPPAAAPGTGPPGVKGPGGALAGAALGSAEGGGILAFLVTAVLAGLLTIATPCVFPMLPLTVSILTKRAEKDPARVLPNALIYGAGMFVSLAGVGLAMSLVFGVAPTDLALSPGFNLAIFAFLVLLALSLFGAFDLQLPSFLTNWSQAKAGAGGGTGLFFMGMTLAFTSFACAAPFAGILVLQARTDLGLGVLGMGVYAATFTTPFFLMALFPGLLRRLPRSGGWLNAVKVVMGFVEVAAAFKFLRAADQLWDWGFFSFELVLAIWIACSLGAFLYLLGFVVLPHDTKAEGIGVGRLLWALAFLAAALFMVPGLFGRRLPAFVESFIIRDAVADAGGGTGTGGERAGLPWIRNDLDAALAEARSTGRPVFVDFTGFG